MSKVLFPWLLLAATLFGIVELTLLRGMPARCVPDKQERCLCLVPREETGYQICQGDHYTECHCPWAGEQDTQDVPVQWARRFR